MTIGLFLSGVAFIVIVMGLGLIGVLSITPGFSWRRFWKELWKK